MNKLLMLIIAATAGHLLSADAVYSASFGDMFGGKKAQEYKQILEEKEQECQTRLDEKEYQYKRLIENGKGAEDDVQNLRTKNATLMEAYEKLKKEQDDLMEKAIRIRRDNQRCDEMKESFTKMTEENKAFLEEKGSLVQERDVLSTTLGSLKLHIKEVTAEKDQLAVFLAEAQEDEDVKIKKIRESVKAEIDELTTRVNLLMEENTALTQQNEEAQKKILLAENDNSGLRQQLELLHDGMNDLEKTNTELKNENRYLAKEATQFPKKFADLARHNRKLVKETSHMHYNLGVSNIKSNDYQRAVKEFEKVLELDPKDAYANYNLGYIYAEHLVDRPKAMKYFQAYLTNAEDAKDADWVRKYILTWQTWYGKQGI